jgi:hypothetical protein
VNEFITALLPILRRKIHNLLPQILGQAQLLSHFIHEMIKFDAVLRDEFSYVPYGERGWKGVTHEVLTLENGFTGWIKVEKECKIQSLFSFISFVLTTIHTFNQLLYRDTIISSARMMLGLSTTTAQIRMTQNPQNQQSG